ncbi:MAG TPA: YetF domain-containing protein [Caulobacteraceae bacterium]
MLLLRISGKRTLSKMNAFDSVVTIAIGSTFASALISRDVTIASAVSAIALLVFLQFAITWLSVRLGWVRRGVKAEPRLLYHDGRVIEPALKRERVSREELEAAARSRGYGDLAQVKAVVLETTGEFSVIGHALGGAMSDVASEPPDTRL